MKSIRFFISIVLVAFCICSCQHKDDFVTPDLTFFELKGHVQSVKYEYDSQTLVFTPDGELESQGGDNPYFENGHYIGFCRGEKELSDYFVTFYDITSQEYYKWADGHVVHSTTKGEGAHTETEYMYDEKGELKSIKSERGEGMSSCVWKETYTITKRDKNGNWIEREVLREQLTPFYHDGFLISKPNTSKSTETRTIAYY